EAPAARQQDLDERAQRAQRALLGVGAEVAARQLDEAARQELLARGTIAAGRTLHELEQPIARPIDPRAHVVAGEQPVEKRARVLFRAALHRASTTPTSSVPENTSVTRFDPS